MTNANSNQNPIGGINLRNGRPEEVPPNGNGQQRNPQHYEREFEQPVILRQSPFWSRAIVWTIVGVTTFGIAWSAIAKIEQVVPARGQLKPQGAVREIQAPVNGVVREVYVKDGDRVEVGDLLLVFDSSSSKSQLESLQGVKQSLQQQNQFYRRLMGQAITGDTLSQAIVTSNIPPEVYTQARELDELRSENRLFNNQISGVGSGARFNSARLEVESRRDAKRREIEQARSQILQLRQQQEQRRKEREQAVVQTNDTKAQLQTATEIRDSLSVLNEEGAFPQLQFKQQEQQVQSLQAEVNRLTKEQERLTIAIAEQDSAVAQTQSVLAQRQQELNNINFAAEVNLRDRIAANDKRISQIETELSRRIADNDNRVKELDSQITQIKQTIGYQELRAPVAGTIFDLQASEPEYVANPTDVVMKIVPDDNLVAEVFITNADIGFVRTDQKVDVRVDAFPYNEFGDVQGKVTFIASEALEPDQLFNYYRFPATVTLEKQTLELEEREKPIPLQSGMGISANIIIRENRTVLSLFTEKFTKGVESFKEVR